MKLSDRKIPISTTVPVGWLPHLEQRAQQERTTVSALLPLGSSDTCKKHRVADAS